MSGFEMDDGTPPRAIDVIAKDNPSLARMLKGLDQADLHRKIEELFVEAYRAGDDEEAYRIMQWYVAGVREIDHARDVPAGFAPTSAAFTLSYRLTPGNGVWPSERPMVKTKKALAEAVARGLAYSDYKSATQYLTILLVNYHSATTHQKIVLDAIKGVTADMPRANLLKFAAIDSVPDEMRRVLMNGWMRNSGIEPLVGAVEIASMLEGCTPHAYENIKRVSSKVAELDGYVRELTGRLTKVAGIVGVKIESSYSFEPTIVSIKMEIDNGSSWDRSVHEHIWNECTATACGWGIKQRSAMGGHIPVTMRFRIVTKGQSTPIYEKDEQVV